MDIKHASQGLALISCKNNTISGNTFAENGLEGIYLYNSPNNTLIENNVSSNGEKSWGLHYLGQGIRIEMSNYCVIINNIIGDNYEYGLRLWNSNYCTITGCDISHSDDGIYSWSCKENVIQSNSIYANINGIRMGYSNTNTIIGNYFLDNKYYAIQLERSDNNLISGNSLPTGQCIYQDKYCSGNSGDDIQGHACPVPPPEWFGELLITLLIMAALIAFQYFVGKKARKMARKRKERFLEARKTLDPAVREFYRTHHGFDPFNARKERWGVVSHFEETFPLTNDPSLLAADISVSARVDFFSDGRSLNRIIFRRGKQEASVTCTHTVIYEGPADEAVGLSSDLEPGSTIMALPKVNSRNPPESTSNAPPPVNSPGDQPPPEQSSTPVARQIEAGNGKPADLLPWEHFAALKSYVAAIAEEGIGNLLANSFCSDEDDQYNQVTGFNTAMQTQILNALTRIGPKHVTAMILTRMLESIVSTEDRLKWFKLRFPVMDKYYHIRYHLRNTPDIQAIFVGAVEHWGCAHIPEEILYCLADSPLLSITAAGIMSQLPYPRILKKLKIKARQVVEQPFR